MHYDNVLSLRGGLLPILIPFPIPDLWRSTSLGYADDAERRLASEAPDRDGRWVMPGWSILLVCGSHWSLAHDFQSKSLPRGWLNAIAFPFCKSQVCAAKHATGQWKLAVWMMVITLTTEAANASMQEGAVCCASLMSVQEQEFIYLLLVWLNCSAGEAPDRAAV